MLNKLRSLFKKGIITEQYSLSNPLNELIFAKKRAEGHFFGYLKNRIIWYFFPRYKLLTRFPTHIDIEISSRCQLNCPMCYTTTDYFKNKVDKGFLDFDLFKKIIDESKKYNLYSVRFSWRGEPLLHPKIIDMLKYAKANGVKEVSFLSNGGKLTPEIIDGLIINGLDWLTVSFDGLHETYEYYRKPLKFDETIAKLKLIQKRKKELKIKKPVLKVQSVWPAIEKNHDEYFAYMSEIADEVAFNPIKDKEYYKEFDIAHYKKDYVCPRLWQRIAVSSSGNICFCLSDVYEDEIAGNIKDMSIYEAWHSKAFKEMRRKHLEHDRFQYAICRRCQAGLKREEHTVELGSHTIAASKYEFD